MILTIVFLPMGMAFLTWAAGKYQKRLRNLLAAGATLAELCLTVALLFLPQESVSISGAAGLGLSFETDGFREIYLVIIAFLWLMTTLFGDEYFSHYQNCDRYYFFNLLTLGATMGVFLAADLVTALVFFEIMSFTSYTWVIQEETEAAIRAANTYLAVAVIGGLVALMGLFLFGHYLGTTRLSELYAAAQHCGNQRVLYIAGGCVLFGFGAKAGMFPLHIWLPKAHPVAPAPASALLSGLLTKTGIFGVLVLTCRVFYHDPAWGTLILCLGTITMLLGALLALFSIDLKRTLACSSVSQIGFILVGIGMMGLLGDSGTLAAGGTILHMMNHSLFKLILFLSAGAVYMNLHELDLNRIRGFGRGKPFLLIPFLTAALGIGGFPLLNGYVSKTLLHESIVEGIEILDHTHIASSGLHIVEWIFLFSGGLTVAYMLKLFVAVFMEKNPTRQAEFDARKAYMTPISVLALLFPVVILVLFGVMPNRIMMRIAENGMDFLRAEPAAHTILFFSWNNLKGGFISIGIGILVYFGFVRTVLMRRKGETKEYVNLWPSWLDLEEAFYRPLLLKWLPGFFGFFADLFGNNRITGTIAKGMMSVAEAFADLLGNNRITGTAAKGLYRGAEVFFHGLSDSLDALILFLRKTVYKDIIPAPEDSALSSISYRAGAMMDRTLARKGQNRKDGKHYSDLVYRAMRTISSTSRMLTGGLSFALLMLVLAITFVFLYVLFMR